MKQEGAATVSNEMKSYGRKGCTCETTQQNDQLCPAAIKSQLQLFLTDFKDHTDKPLTLLFCTKLTRIELLIN